jgi:MYXO-CTERM domain-containing protein
MVSAGVSPAPAAFITGQFSMSGNDTYDLTANTIQFIAGTTTVTASSGDFAAAGLTGSAITWNQGETPGPAVDYTTLTGLLFSGISGLTFTLTGIADFEEDFSGLTSLDITGDGILTLTGSDPTPGVFSLTTQGGNGPVTVTFSATTVAVPGPVVGAGLPALFALGGLVAFARRRRRVHTA